MLSWQELKTKRSSRRKNSSSFENKDGNLRSSGSTSGVSNSKAVDNSAFSINHEESGTSRRKQNKNIPRQQTSLKQRFFSSNFRNHGTGRNSHGFISESPPSNSVGYFFGSTPPENHGLVESDCCWFLYYNTSDFHISIISSWKQ